MTPTQDRAVDLFVDAGMLAAHQDVLPEAVEALGETLACEGLVDMTGRCIECGRLVVKGAHPQRGCAAAIPFVGLGFWLWDNRYSIPYLGKAAWLHQRRRKSATKDAHIPPSDLPPSGGGM